MTERPLRPGMEITSLNAHCRHRPSIWDVSEFPPGRGSRAHNGVGMLWMMGAAGCLQSGQVCLRVALGAWVQPQRGPREVAGVGKAALQSVWCQWLCVTGQGGELILSAGSGATLPCTCGLACADPTPRDAQMLLVTALGVLEEKCSGAV